MRTRDLISAKHTGTLHCASLAESSLWGYVSRVRFFARLLAHSLKTLNEIVTRLLGGHHHHRHDHHDHHDRSQKETRGLSQEEEAEPPKEETDVHGLNCPCHTDDPAGQLETLQHMAEEIETFERAEHDHWQGAQSEPNDSDDEGKEPEESDTTSVAPEERQDTQKLMRMSVNTALAIVLHNFPEGLATFVAALDDPRVGAVLAVAISIHNIPEGLCVAMPIYYATGNRWKAFGWALLSGVAEPFAAVLGWAVLANSFSDQMYGVLFGIVSGMMVIISVRELLPTAHRYDPEDRVVTYAFMFGMAIMAVSLVLFFL